jgi:hypothetical protein
MLEAYGEVDKALADLNGNTAAFRLQEDAAHIEGMAQEFASSLFYANEATAPEEITGLAPRYNSLSAANADNILQSGTTPDTSVWLVAWAPSTVFGLYPKGSRAGIQAEDKGQVTVQDTTGSTNGRMEAYLSHYRWDCGVALADWRYVVRIQVDFSELTKGAASGPDLPDLMLQAMRHIPSLERGRPAFYAHRDVLSFLDRQSRLQGNLGIRTIDDGHGKLITTFNGVPVRRCDALTSTESAVA